MSRRRHAKTLGRRRARALAGKWADAHPGFPWYGIGWGWHVFLIWPTILWGVTNLVMLPIRAARYAASPLPPQQNG
jgi:hypothetical protein